MSKPITKYALMTPTLAAVMFLSACTSQYSSPDVSAQDDKVVKDEYYGPGGMKQYKKDKDREAQIKAKEACQEAQIDLVEAKSANDLALVEMIQKKINKVCADKIKIKNKEEK